MLYIVGTPLGNLGDISKRAIETLNSVDLIACEDTRHSLRLLNALEIKKPLVAYHKFNEREASKKLVQELLAGKNIALITDAGMPVISDPGNILIEEVIANDIEFTVVPGACAFVSALVLSGLKADRFCFLGFLPDKEGERKRYIEKYKTLDTTLIFYSAPHDVNKNLKSLYEVLGDRRAVTVREITKMYEEREDLTLGAFEEKERRGEYVILVEGYDNKDVLALSEKEHIDLYLSQGMDKKEALKLVAKERGVSKSSLYKYTIED